MRASSRALLPRALTLTPSSRGAQPSRLSIADSVPASGRHVRPWDGGQVYVASGELISDTFSNVFWPTLEDLAELSALAVVKPESITVD